MDALTIAALEAALLNGGVAFIVFVVILAVGIILALLFGRILHRILEAARIEEFIEKHGLKEALLGFTLSDLIVWAFEIYVILFVLAIGGGVASVNVLVNWAMGGLNYMASAVQGLTILVVGLFIGEYISDRIKTSDVFAAGALAMIVEIFIAYNALVLALPALLPNVDTSLLKISFIYFIGALLLGLAIAVGIAFGFGLKDAISRIAVGHLNDIEGAFFGEVKVEKKARRRRKH